MYYKTRFDHDLDNRPEFKIDSAQALQLMVVANTLKI